MRVTFTVTKGTNEGTEFSFDQYASFVVGRHRETQFRLSLEDRTLSRFHFLIEINPQGCAIVDLKSKNYTFINSKIVKDRVLLNEGDEIKAGKTHLRVSIEKREAPGEVAYRDDHLTPDIPGFRVIRKLGTGTTGTVYQAFDESRRSMVALKLIAPKLAVEPLWMKRIEREATIHRQLAQRHIASLLDFVQNVPQPYLVMEYVSGKTALGLLQETATAGDRIPIARAVGLIRQTLDALAYAHHAGVMHRDIKPANLMISEVEGRDFVKIIDFGLAGFFVTSDLSRLTQTNMLMGSVGYMAPEQMIDSAKVNSKADIYAVGATLYALLTGMTPYALPTGKTSCIEMRVEGSPQPIERFRQDIPQELVFLIDRVLSRNPNDRPDARTFQDALAPWTNSSG